MCLPGKQAFHQPWGTKSDLIKSVTGIGQVLLVNELPSDRLPPPLPPKKGPNKLDSRNSPCHIWGVSLSEVYANVKTFLRSISGIASLDKVLLLKNYTLTTTSSSSIETEGECGRQPCSYKSFKRKMSVSRETRTISMLKFVWGIRVSTFSLFFFFSLVLVFVFFPLEDFMWADII